MPTFFTAYLPETGSFCWSGTLTVAFGDTPKDNGENEEIRN